MTRTETAVSIAAIVAMLTVLTVAGALARNPFELALYIVAGVVLLVLAGGAVWKVRT